MKTVKVIHYPEGGNRTTEIFEAENVKVVEGYMHELLSEQNMPLQALKAFDGRSFGARMNFDSPEKYWIILLYLDDVPMMAGLNSKVYVMVDGKTVASYESIIID